jgi:hypothetical protein
VAAASALVVFEVQHAVTASIASAAGIATAITRPHRMGVSLTRDRRPGGE